MPQELYEHRRLVSPESVRIISLKPSPHFAAPLEVTLHEVCLNESPLDYEALSYVWGAPTGDRALICDGNKALSVTSNCESALRYLRRTHEERRLWVDAICIDQSDGMDSVKERNVQVVMMGKVYNKATRTICWLGEGTEFTAETLKQLGEVGKYQWQQQLDDFKKHDIEFS
jgi:hypothetical protein